jgi:hypothetical protein
VSALSLPVGLWEGLFSWREFGEESFGRYPELWRASKAVAALAGLGYAAGAALLWLVAVRRFEREGK